MPLPPQPTNPRVVYPNGRTIPLRKLWYGAQIHDTHVWVSEDPAFVAWVAGAHTEYDGTGSHVIVVGFDMTGQVE